MRYYLDFFHPGTVKNYIMDFLLRRYIFTFVLSLMVALAVPKYVLAADKPKGADTYLTFCGGCHGFEGEPVYIYAPSFYYGDRMQKSDAELLQSVLNGTKGMPHWEGKLPVEDLRNAIDYLRLMYERYKKGEPSRQEEMPDVHYYFKPTGKGNLDWVTE